MVGPWIGRWRRHHGSAMDALFQKRTRPCGRAMDALLSERIRPWTSSLSHGFCPLRTDVRPWTSSWLGMCALSSERIIDHGGHPSWAMSALFKYRKHHKYRCFGTANTESSCRCGNREFGGAGNTDGTDIIGTRSRGNAANTDGIGMSVLSIYMGIGPTTTTTTRTTHFLLWLSQVEGRRRTIVPS